MDMNFDYEQIERYIEGKLEGEALAKFKAKLLTNKALAEEVALYKDVNMTLTSAYAHEQEDAALAQTFNQLGKKYFTKSTTIIQETDSAKIKQDNTRVVPMRLTPKEKNTNQWSGFRWLRPAIGLAVAALIALLIWQPWQGSLVDSYYQPYALNITERSGDKEQLAQAEKAYKSGDYAAALPVFEQYPNNVEVQLAKGNAAYNLGKLDAAATTFQQIASGNSIYTSTANWYLALTYLKQEKTAEAQTILQKIPNNSDDYKQAQQLLNEMSK